MDAVLRWTTLPFIDAASQAVIWIVSPATALALLFVTAPLGRMLASDSSAWWGIRLHPRLAWVVMEAPNLVALPLFVRGATSGGSAAVSTFLLSLYIFHYVYRALVYPFRARSAAAVPFVPFAMAFAWCLFNGVMHGRFFAQHVYDESWVRTPRFVVGVALFFVGWIINFTSDETLQNLRKPGETGYKIPHGGLFEYVAAPNYFGEVVEWAGYAIATGAPCSWAFAAFTAANLIPRAVTALKWYRGKFREYPTGRRAIIPFVL